MTTTTLAPAPVRTKTLAQRIASAIQARSNCIARNNIEWRDRWEETLAQLAHELPSGSGVDSGTTIDLDKSTGERIVLHTAFHHMHESGMYNGWTEHTIRVTPDWSGVNLTISGRDRNGVKEYLADLFYTALAEEK